MNTHILLLRGVNVGGHNRLPMRDLRDIAIACGAETARTYLQSGNLVVEGGVDPETLSQAIHGVHGFAPAILHRTAVAWSDIVHANPFPEVQDHRALHVFFLSGPTEMTASDLVSVSAPGEVVHMVPGHVYLYSPKGLSQSKIAPRIERLAGVGTTARNWRTVMALNEMAANI